MIFIASEVTRVLLAGIYFVLCKFFLFDLFYTVTKSYGDVEGAALAVIGCVLPYVVAYDMMGARERYADKKAEAQDQAQNKASDKVVPEA